MTLQNASAIIGVNSSVGGTVLVVEAVPVGQALLVTALGNTVTVYNLSATDTGIPGLTKTQIAQKTVS